MHKSPHTKKSFLLQHSRKIIIFLGFIALLVALTNSAVNREIGNLFFGKVGSLYNISFARFFFTRASYPVLGKASPYSHYQLSRTHFITGNFAGAISEAEKELDLYPDHIRTYYILGLTYGYINSEEKAIKAFSKFIEHNPNSWAARNDKAWLQFRTGDIDGALSTITPVAYGKENAWIQNTYGTILMNKKQYPEAIKAFSYAKKALDTMTEESWGQSYPGNDPRIYSTGLKAMKLSIENNLKLLGEK